MHSNLNCYHIYKIDFIIIRPLLSQIILLPILLTALHSLDTIS